MTRTGTLFTSRRCMALASLSIFVVRLLEKHLYALYRNSSVLAGTAVYLYGSANCSYQVTVDGTASPVTIPGENLLYAQEGLPLGTHRVDLVMMGPTDPSGQQQLAFDRAVVTDATQAEYVLAIL